MAQKKAKSISTKGGDRGETSLFDGSRVKKSSLRPEAYGTLDEASAFIGFARAGTPHSSLKKALLKIQGLIYLANGELACPPEAKKNLPKRFEKNDLLWVEEEADRVEKTLNLPRKFILYGETETGALLDMARAVVRRGERALSALNEESPLDNPFILPFVNRLSDLLYLLARFDEKEAGVTPHTAP